MKSASPLVIKSKRSISCFPLRLIPRNITRYREFSNRNALRDCLKQYRDPSCTKPSSAVPTRCVLMRLRSSSREGLVRHAREVDTHTHTQTHTLSHIQEPRPNQYLVFTWPHFIIPPILFFLTFVSGTSGKSEGCNGHSKQFVARLMQIFAYMWLLTAVQGMRTACCRCLTENIYIFVKFRETAAVTLQASGMWSSLAWQISTDFSGESTNSVFRQKWRRSRFIWSISANISYVRRHISEDHSVNVHCRDSASVRKWTLLIS
jgi:hypothetical protein